MERDARHCNYKLGIQVYVRLLSLLQEINSASLNTQSNTQKFVFAAVVKYEFKLTKFMDENKMAVVIAMNTTYCNDIFVNRKYCNVIFFKKKFAVVACLNKNQLSGQVRQQENYLWPHS